MKAREERAAAIAAERAARDARAAVERLEAKRDTLAATVKRRTARLEEVAASAAEARKAASAAEAAAKTARERLAEADESGKRLGKVLEQAREDLAAALEAEKATPYTLAPLDTVRALALDRVQRVADLRKDLEAETVYREMKRGGYAGLMIPHDLDGEAVESFRTAARDAHAAISHYLERATADERGRFHGDRGAIVEDWAWDPLWAVLEGDAR